MSGITQVQGSCWDKMTNQMIQGPLQPYFLGFYNSTLFAGKVAVATHITSKDNKLHQECISPRQPSCIYPT